MTELGRLGRYRLLRRIAVGGVAEVYLAAAEGLAGFSKRVVVKRLHPEHARAAELVSMFLDEARLGALLRHPHIVEVYDIGAEGGDYFIAMEHIAGHDLRDLLNARPGEPLPLPAALGIVQAVARGLHHAHEQRDAGGKLLDVVHRDVTPANVLLGWDGTVKLSDFGVAKWTEQRSRTEQGTLKGKLSYMSPEQCRGQALDRRSDVFALGVLLYELTTGDRPFRAASDFETLSAIVAGRYDAPADERSGYPPALEAIVRRALAVDPDQRFPDAAALDGALGEVALALEARGGAADVAACLRERFPDGEITPEPVEIAPLAAAPSSAERTQTDAAAAGGNMAATARALDTAEAFAPGGEPAPERRRSRALALMALGVVAVAGSLLVVLAGSSSAPAPPASSTSASARPAAPAPAGPPTAEPAAAPRVSPAVPPTGEASRPSGPAPSGAAVAPVAPARRRPVQKPRPPDSQTVWDPDSPKLP